MSNPHLHGVWGRPGVGTAGGGVGDEIDKCIIPRVNNRGSFFLLTLDIIPTRVFFAVRPWCAQGGYLGKYPLR